MDSGVGVAVDKNSGSVTVTGKFMNTVDFGGGPLVAGTNVVNAFVAKYSSSGAPLWSKSYFATLSDEGYATASDGNGSSIVAGDFFGTVDLGSGPLTSLLTGGGVSSADVFLLDVGP